MAWEERQPLDICLASVVQRIGQPSQPWPNDSVKEKALDFSSRAWQGLGLGVSVALGAQPQTGKGGLPWHHVTLTGAWA